jgi:hypothetical protein
VNRTFFFSLVVSVFAISAAHAENSPAVVEKPMTANTLDSFNQASANIHKQMEVGGVYEHITAPDRGRVEARLVDMQKILQKNTGQADMNATDKVALLNAQEEINGVLRHNDDNRLVCEHKSPVGSHLPVTTCVTYGEMMARHRNDQKTMQDSERVQGILPANAHSH